MSKTIYHMHHIVPKHMGGSDDPSNLVRLTVEEHAQAHLELYEQHGDERDLLAHRMLLGQITRADAIKKIQKLPKSEGWKEKARERSIGEGNPMYGKTISDEQKQKISEANRIPKPWVSESAKLQHSEGRGYKFTEEDLKKAINNRRSRKWYTNGVDNVSVCDGDPIPDGYYRGRTTGWKTHP